MHFALKYLPQKNMRIANMLWCIAFISILVWQGAYWTTIGDVPYFPDKEIKLSLQLVFLASLLLSLLYQKIPFKSLLKVLPMGLVLATSAVVCDDDDLLLAFGLIVGAQDIDLKKVAKIVSVFCVVVLISSIVASSAGLIEMRYTIEPGMRGAVSSYGFSHPNRFAYTIFLFCISWLFTRFPAYRAVDIGVVVLSLLMIVIQTGSKSSAIMLVLLALVTGVFFKMRDDRKAHFIFARVIIGVLLLVFVGSLVMMACYDSGNSLHSSLDSLLTGRLRLANEYFQSYPPHIFGTSFENAPVRVTGFASRLVVDNSYARLLILYGYAATLIVFLVCVALCTKYLHAKMCSLALLFFGVMLVFGVVESMTISITSNFFLLLLAELLPWKRKVDDARRISNGGVLSV